MDIVAEHTAGRVNDFPYAGVSVNA